MRIDEWMTVYSVKLAEAVETCPEEYGFPLSDVPRVAGKMREAFIRGTFNKDGKAIKATSRHFKVPHTYAGIKGFIAS